MQLHLCAGCMMDDMSDDGTGRASLTKVVDLTTMADSFVLGWKQAILLELDTMRAEMPYADIAILRLECRRESSATP